MIETLLTEKQQRLRDEVRAFVREDVPRQLILDMDAGRVTYPRQFLECAAARRMRRWKVRRSTNDTRRQGYADCFNTRSCNQRFARLSALRPRSAAASRKRANTSGSIAI